MAMRPIRIKLRTGGGKKGSFLEYWRVTEPPDNQELPMSSLPDLAQTLQTVLIQVPQQHARSSGVTQRRSKLRAEVLVQTLVLGWLAEARSTLEQLCQMAARRGVS